MVVVMMKVDVVGLDVQEVLQQLLLKFFPVAVVAPVSGRCAQCVFVQGCDAVTVGKNACSHTPHEKVQDR